MKAVKADKEKQITLLQTVLTQIKMNDPRFMLLIKKELNRYNKGLKEKEINKEIIRRLRIQNKKLMERVASLRDQLKQAKVNRNQVLSRLNDLRKLNKLLADALGSCGICWGEDVDCVHCSGNGGPGWRNINRRLFNIYILPTLEKVYGLNK